jgi:chromosome segregation ATPase
MSAELSNVLTKIESQLNQRGFNSQRNLYNNLSKFQNINYKPSFTNKTEGNERKDTIVSNSFNNRTYGFNNSNFLSTRQPQLSQEQETRKLIEQELEPIVKHFDESLYNIRKEFNEYKYMSNDIEDIKKFSNKNQLAISNLENEIALMKNSNNYRNSNNDTEFLKNEINELNNRLNELNKKFEQLTLEIQQKDNMMTSNLTKVAKENEIKLNNELNTLKNRITTNKNSFNVFDNKQDDINELREDFKDEINKIYNTIQSVQEGKYKNVMNYNLDNEVIEQFNKKMSALENQIMQNNTLLNSNYVELNNKIMEIKNIQNQQLPIQILKNDDNSPISVQHDNHLNIEVVKLKQQIDNNTNQIKEFEKYFEDIQTNFGVLENHKELTETYIKQLSINLEMLMQKVKELLEPQENHNDENNNDNNNDNNNNNNNNDNNDDNNNDNNESEEDSNNVLGHN